MVVYIELSCWGRNSTYFNNDNRGCKMNSKEIEPLITKAIAAEYESANEKFPPFNSVHEGYAVLLEEVEEAKAEIERIEVYMKTLWSAVKRDYNKSCFASAYDVKCSAVRAMQELVQVCAMCDKFGAMNEQLHISASGFYLDDIGVVK